MSAWTLEEQRTARLLFSHELHDGRVDEATVVGSDEVHDSVRSRRVPPALVRFGQAAARRFAGWHPQRSATSAAVRARRAVLGDSASGPPRVLLRMDEYPHWLAGREPERYGDRAFGPWLDIMRDAECPHLVAVVPRIAEDPERPRGASRGLTVAEVDQLIDLRAAGAEFGLHGYEHRTRFRNPHRHTELGRRRPHEVGKLLDRALHELLERAGVRPRVLVPPFNTFDADALPQIATRFPVVTGGPESVLRLGFHPPAVWRGDTVYLPAYAPLYGTAADVLPEVKRHVEDRTGLWTPVVIHWGWESEAGWKDLERLVEYLAPFARPWSEFFDAVEESR